MFRLLSRLSNISSLQEGYGPDDLIQDVATFRRF